MFDCLARAGRFRDEETAEHVERMSRTCALIARELGFAPRDCTNLMLASAMHDIGKIGVPDAVLLKPGPLNAEERALIERHPEIGHQILTGSRAPVMQLAATIALTHHERVDGCGYPRGLRGDRIPLPGRIAAVADVFDALTHDRVYRPALSIDGALSVLHEGRGPHFDARVIDALDAVLPKVVEIRRRYPNSVEHKAGRRYTEQQPRRLLTPRTVTALP
jgi:HD-GYP domain-containing protein (c-di-GMP phosphodiesterase class II)